MVSRRRKVVSGLCRTYHPIWLSACHGPGNASIRRDCGGSSGTSVGGDPCGARSLPPCCTRTGSISATSISPGWCALASLPFSIPNRPITRYRPTCCQGGMRQRRNDGSKGGSILAKWCLAHHQEIPLYLLRGHPRHPEGLRLRLQPGAGQALGQVRDKALSKGESACFLDCLPHNKSYDSG